MTGMWSCFKSQSTNPDRPIVKSNILVVQVYCTPGSINNVITALNKHCSKRASKIYDGGNSSKTENRWMLYGQLGSRGLQNYQSCLNDVVKVTGVSRAAIQTNDFDIYRMYAPAQLTKAENKGIVPYAQLNWKEGDHRPNITKVQCSLKGYHGDFDASYFKVWGYFSMPDLVWLGFQNTDVQSYKLEEVPMDVLNYHPSENGLETSLTTNKNARLFADRRPTSITLVWKHPGKNCGNWAVSVVKKF